VTHDAFEQWLCKPRRRTLVMGVLNVTPDSFSDGGRYAEADAAVARAEQIAEEGADLIDIGGESTRPRSDPVSPEEQIRRVVPVLKAVAGRLPVLFSIDTTRSEVARAALDAGAAMINDTSGARNDPGMLPLAAGREVPIVLMHMQGIPATMQNAPAYGDVVAEVREFLGTRAAAAQAAGVGSRHILLDPGIGFGKTIDHNLALLRRQRELLSLNRPLVIGTSRKKFIGALTGEPEPARRLFGTAAATAWSVANGAGIVRVHDVRPNVQVVRMIEAIVNSGG
jgi:dihydropteroate synthase